MHVVKIISLIRASHSCILVTGPSENEPVEPAESVEPEPGAPFVVESEVNPGKQLSIFLAPIKFDLV